MSDQPSVLQYQFVQRGESIYEMRLVVRPDFAEEEVITSRLRALLGDRAELRLLRVPQLEPLPSGKRPYILNEWKQKQSQ